MIGGRFARVVREASFLRHYRVGARGDYDIAGQLLLLKDPIGFISDDLSAGNVDAKGEGPETVFNAARFVRWHEDARSHYN